MSSQAEETDKPLFKWSEFSDAERRLAAELAYHMARVLWEHLSKCDRTYQTDMYNVGMSVYEHSCSILHALGVFRQTGAMTYRFEMPLESVRDFLTSGEIESPIDFDELMLWFIELVVAHADLLGEERAPFEPPLHLLDLMAAFADLGYADRIAGGFAWTDKITPYMQAAYLWDKKTGVPRATQFKADVAAFADELWFSMPVWRRHLMARSIVGKDGLEIYSFLLRKWENGRFRFLPKFPWYILPKSVRFKAMRLRDRIFGKRPRLPDELSPALTEIIRRLVIVRKSHPF